MHEILSALWPEVTGSEQNVRFEVDQAFAALRPGAMTSNPWPLSRGREQSPA